MMYKKEMEWLAFQLAGTFCPGDEEKEDCPEPEITLDVCMKCWLNAAKEAVHESS